MYYWIMGGGGIGRALARECLGRGDKVVLFSRSDPDIKGVDWLAVDNTNLAALAEATRERVLPDRVINTLGMLHQDEQQPEKRIEEVTQAALANSIRINTWPTLAMAQLLSSRLSRRQPLQFAALSARVGSIGDNRAGGWYSYRISKAALNMAIKTLSIEWQRRFPLACVVGLHPGTVATELSAPFRSGLADGQLQSPELAALHLLMVLDGLSPEHSGRIFAWDGQEIQP
ncbi:NAD(P)-dependent dehydrogenase (short-subunit alcohol dehydrogenase family) [Oceanisphaera litoralis]|uniref:SDR family NAD(P)-dependent oxidoreductase n=1 Tax=Oceanisphaera litoralis TaxID=225144 RepID=UPI0019574CF0|nr:SDR family NAD(P)-dependent oxidoreductase [Oceanisphaera litoralis]MBM7455614.1 NAD(P)-dependent dehydrogenase (short-subunit alcohol dehydrogenase family) [Oceanisphaera litoralis]